MSIKLCLSIVTHIYIFFKMLYLCKTKTHISMDTCAGATNFRFIGTLGLVNHSNSHTLTSWDFGDISKSQNFHTYFGNFQRNFRQYFNSFLS